MSKILILAVLLIETISEVRLSQDRPHQFYNNLHWYPPRFNTESQEETAEKNSVFIQQPNKFTGEVSVLADRYPFFKRSKISDYDKEFSYTAACGHCQIRDNVRDLGPDYFPRYVPDVECAKSSKCPGVFECKRKIYKLAVLKRRDENEMDSEYAPLLPLELREKWIFNMTPITVACECSIF